jgi:hypothetical protein
MENTNFKYLEVVKDSNDIVVKRIDVTGKSERMIESCVNGLSINLNHSDYSIREENYENEQNTNL